MSQRACRKIDPGQIMRHMTGKATSVLVMRLQFINRKKAAFGKSRIDGRSGMTFTENKTIPILHFRVVTVDMKYFGIQYSHDIRNGQYRAKMTSTR